MSSSEFPDDPEANTRFTASSDPTNPYDPNPFGDSPATVDMAGPPIRPGGLTAICVIVIVLGAMGMMSSGLKGVQLAVGKALQQAITQATAQPNNEMGKAQEEMTKAIWEETDKLMIPNLLLISAQFAICGALAYGGIKSMGLKEVGWKVLVWAVCLILVFEIIQFFVIVYTQLQIMPIMEVHMARMMESTPNSGPSEKEFMGAITKFSMIIGFVFHGGWTLLKVVFFCIAIRYLRSQRIIGLMTGQTGASTPAEVL